MRAFVVSGPRRAGVFEVEDVAAGPGTVVVDVERAGVCGTDVEFFTGEMAYLHQGHAAYPMRLGHEWCGRVSAVGPDVDPAWLGRRVTGDTMLGCGACARCADGRRHVCERRHEIGIRGGWPGALAERLPVPVGALHALPDTVGPAAGALVEPGGNAIRAVRAAGAAPGTRVLVCGPGTIGLLTAMFARAAGAEVHVLVPDGNALAFPAGLNIGPLWTVADPPPHRYDAVVDATNDPSVPALALSLVEPGKRIVYIGLSGSPSLVDTRDLVLGDVTAVGILGGSQGLAEAIEWYAAGRVDPTPLVAATVPLSRTADVLAGWRPPPPAGPKIHIDPTHPEATIPHNPVSGTGHGG